MQDGELLLQRVGEAEHQRRHQRADRVPAAEDHRGKADEAAPAGHVVVEAADRAEREPGAAEAGDHAADGHVDVAQAIDVDAERVGGFRVLADGAGAQAAARVEQVVGRDRHQDEAP